MNLIETSKKDWNSYGSIESINAGSLQRIVDASERMATNFIALQNDRDLYKRWYNEECSKVSKLHRRINSLRGVITKLKKR